MFHHLYDQLLSEWSDDVIELKHRRSALAEIINELAAARRDDLEEHELMRSLIIHNEMVYTLVSTLRDRAGRAYSHLPTVKRYEGIDAFMRELNKKTRVPDAPELVF